MSVMYPKTTSQTNPLADYSKKIHYPPVHKP